MKILVKGEKKQNKPYRYWTTWMENEAKLDKMIRMCRIFEKPCFFQILLALRSKMEKTVLLDMIVEDLGSSFLKRLYGRMPAVWNEAMDRSITDNYTHEALKRYAFGQARYFLVQSLFLDVGQECGYESRIIPCDQNNYPIAIVQAGRFIFTAHYTFNPTEKYALNSSFTRQQHSAINNAYVHRAQQPLFGPTFDVSKVSAATEVRANILFGCGGIGLDFENHGFLRIAIPSVEPAKGNGEGKVLFVENHDCRDVLLLITKKEQQVKAKPVINVATPQIKMRK